MSIVKGEHTKTILLGVAGLLVLGALLLQMQLAKNDEIKKITDKLAQYGYVVSDDSIYIEGDYPDTSIAALLPGVDLEKAVEASKKAGFPSRINERGDVVLLLAATRNEEIITLYMRNGEMELCFIQKPGSDEVFPLGEAAK